MKLAVRIKADDTTEIMDISGDSLTALQGAVGGYVEAVTLKDDLTMWVNEEGKLQGLPVNESATVIFAAAFHVIDTIRGDVVLTGGTDEFGDIVALKDKQATEIVAWVNDGQETATEFTKKGAI